MKLEGQEVLGLQSPVDLVTADAVQQEANLFFEYERKVELIVERHEESVFFVPKGSGNSILINDDCYHLDRFYLRTPSEHAIDGKLFPAEFHLVHQNNNNDFIIVAIILDGFSYSDMTCGVYRTLAQAITKRKNTSEDLEITIDLTHVLSKELDFFWYEGSLTTSPYTPGVRWFVGKRFLPQDILCELELAVAEKNNREIQTRQDRQIFWGHARGRKL
ncbi:MAG: carbonic anhydrase family protein [bacterium]